MLSRRRRAVAIGHAVLAELFLSLFLLAAFQPNLRAMGQAMHEVQDSARDHAAFVSQQGLIDTAIRDFAQDIATPIRCLNPAEATSATECLTFGEPLAAPIPWVQADIINDLDVIAQGFGGAPRAGVMSDHPLCFLAFGQSAGSALGDSTSWTLDCMVWAPPSQYQRNPGETLDHTGGLVFRTYHQAASFDPLRPQFDVSTGGDAEAFIREIAAFRMFWFDSGGLVGASWANRLGCSDDTAAGCSRTLENVPAGFGYPLIDEAFAAVDGIRRVVLFMCPPDTPDLDNDTYSECVESLIDPSITSPAALETALAGTGTFGYRYELIF